MFFYWEIFKYKRDKSLIITLFKKNLKKIIIAFYFTRMNLKIIFKKILWNTYTHMSIYCS